MVCKHLPQEILGEMVHCVLCYIMAADLIIQYYRTERDNCLQHYKNAFSVSYLFKIIIRYIQASNNGTIIYYYLVMNLYIMEASRCYLW